MQWWKEFESLNLYGGNSFYIGNDLEDMIEISYPDGMFIDIGKSEEDSIYYITVLSSNNRLGWQNPLSVVSVSERALLYSEIQETIKKYRENFID
ncbi:MAG: hypothetical protein K2O36_01160 [Ruminococcus sp.]|nr:hypothetical protein [Ruminococcus sp.]MDE7104467.1 hypothetical protein [Ruminococcus sp.]